MCITPTKKAMKSTAPTANVISNIASTVTGTNPDRILPWPISPHLLERSRLLVDHQRLFVSVCHVLHSLERNDKLRHKQALKVIEKATEIRQKEGFEMALLHVKQQLSDVMDEIALVKPSKQDKIFLLFAPILMNYLRQLAHKSLYETCRGVIYVCTEKHKAKEPGYENLASSTMRHLRATVGEELWKRAFDYYLLQKAQGVTRKNS